MTTNAQRTTTRADLIRQRRERKSQKRQDTIVRQARGNSSSPATIIMRGTTMGSPVFKGASSRPRMKVSIPLEAPGSELRLPAIPMIQPSWKILSSFISIILCVFLFMFFASPDFKIKSVNISGIERLSADQIIMDLSLSKTPIFMIDPQQIKTALEKTYPELLNVSVGISLPNFINISAEEREPVIAWHYGEMKSWIDAEGNIFPARGEGTPLLTINSNIAPPLQPAAPENLTILSSIASGEYDENNSEEIKIIESNKVDPQLITAAVSLSELLPKETTLSFKGNDGLGWHDSENNWNVYIGYTLDNLEQKFIVYRAIEEKLKTEGISPDMVSVKFVNAPYYRMEP
ncbi:MAG: FtsQ-type POTRA domain-containing protein [Anaerolineaceae bacterium]|nr:FtsQ-type POTRA domain-containing protein [Anaerolineaceae bacterium]